MSAHDHAADHFLPGLGHARLTPLYDLVHRLLGLSAVHARLVDIAGVGPLDRVLEIGCGTGNLALLVQRRRPDATVVGLDPDPVALARGRRKAARRRLSTRFDEGRAERLPYADGAFDVVLSSLMLHHLHPDARLDALREVRRVLAPGGILALVDLGGAPTRGLAARVARRHPEMLDGLGDRIPELMRAAGLQDPAAVGSVGTRLTGPLAVVRAHAPQVADEASRAVT